MRVETILPPLGSSAIEVAQRAEALGYDAVVSFETSHDPFLPLVLAGEHTSRIGLRTGLAISFPRSPMVVANAAWDLQGYSNGRFELGLGTQVKGHNERRFSVPWTAPAPRMREYVLALRAIWRTWSAGEPLRFEGEHYQFTLMTPMFTPGPIEKPEIPVLVSALGPGMARVAGEVCDGLLLHPMCSYKYVTEVILPAVEQGAKRAGRPLEDCKLYWGGFTASGDSDAELREARRNVARQISFYGSTRTYKEALAIHGHADLCEKLHALSVRGRWAEMFELVPEDLIDALCESGTQEEVAHKLHKRWSGLCSHVTWNPGTDLERTRRVIQILQA
jgi:probable F420-dependent oxidoreductase